MEPGIHITFSINTNAKFAKQKSNLQKINHKILFCDFFNDFHAPR